MTRETLLRLDKDSPHFILQELTKRKEATPDMDHMRANVNYELVFVYGTLKQGFHNHSVLHKSAKYLGVARTYRHEFEMEDTGGFPVVHRVKETEGNYIYGEVYAVTPENVMSLDRLEGNGVMYEREKVQVKFLDQKMENASVGTVHALRKAYIYIGVPTYWQGRNLDKIGISMLEDVSQPAGLVYKGRLAA